MSQAIEQDELVEDQVGQTSDEAESSSAEKRFDLSSLTVYEVMLLISLICIGLATILLLFELRSFGNFPFSFPWRTEEVFINVN